ncbi:MAG: hypothetical protein R3F65_26400 [bacterium]
MSAPSIHCCHRGCTLAVWAEGPAGLEVNCSSATCMTCRRVALCLAHFERVAVGRQGLRCVNCGGRRWYLCLFEPARLDPRLREAVEQAGGRVEARDTRRAGRPTQTSRRPASPSTERRRSEPDAAEHSASEQRRARTEPRIGGPPPLPGAAPPLDPRVRPWSWLPARAVPADARAAAPGVLVRRLGDRARPVVDGVALDLTFATIDTVTRAPSGTPDVVVAGRDPAGRCRLVWCDGAGHRLDLPTPPSGRLEAPAFIDDHRFVYIAVVEEVAELREATIEGATRIRTRRIAALGAASSTPLPPPAAFQHREAVAAFAAADDGIRPMRIRLADGHRSALDGPQAVPRRLVAARRGSIAAWITPDGEVRCAGPGLSARVLGQTRRDLLAIADDGAAVAWVVRDQLAIAEPRRGDVQLYPLPEAIAALSWAPHAPRATRAAS